MAERSSVVQIPREREQERPSKRSVFQRLRANPPAMLGLIGMVLIVLIAAFGPLLYTTSATRIDYTAINALPSAAHPFGTDNIGRDTLARLISGLRVSLLVAFYVELLNISLGVTLGLLAGYFGGWLDQLVTRVADALFAFPGLLLAILVAAILGPAVSQQFGGIGRLLLVAGALSLVSWPLMARFVRSQVLVIREQEFVTAALASGGTSRHILTQHVIPHLMGLVITSSTLNVAGVVVNESVLSLLGLGVQPPEPSIGKMITDAIPFLESNPLQVFLPSLALMLIVICVSFLGDGLRDAFDPQDENA